MSEGPFPDFILSLPQPQNPLAAIQAHLVRGEKVLVMFYEAPEESVEVDEHTHGAQWGVVLHGQTDMEIGGVAQSFRAGDTYSIPAGVPHRATIHRGSSGIDVFADADRYADATAA